MLCISNIPPVPTTGKFGNKKLICFTGKLVVSVRSVDDKIKTSSTASPVSEAQSKNEGNRQ